MVVVGFVALGTYALHGFDGFLRRDYAVYAYAGQQVADGVPPYLGIFNRAGPLAHLLPGIGAALARMADIDDLLGMRLLFMVFSVASVCLVYLLGRDLFVSRRAGLAAAAAILCFEGLLEYATYGPREKTPMVLFLVWSLWAVSRRRWFTAGLMLGLSTLVLQLAFPVGLVAAISGVFGTGRSGRLGAVGRYVTGGLLPLVAFVAYYAVIGALRQFVAAFILANVRYTKADPPHDLAANWAATVDGYGWSVWVLVVGLLSIVVLGVVSVVSRSRHERFAQPWAVAGIAAAAAVGLLWMLRDYDRWPDSLTVVPMAAIGIGGLVHALAKHLPTRVGTAVVLAWVLPAAALTVTFSVTQRDHRLVEQRAAVRAVLAQLPPGATILSINSPQALVLSGKTNPTRFQIFSSGSGKYVDQVWPGGREGLGRWIGRHEPTLITLGHGKAPPKWLEQTMNDDYAKVGRAPGWKWYVNRSVGPEVVTTLRQVAQRHAPR